MSEGAAAKYQNICNLQSCAAYLRIKPHAESVRPPIFLSISKTLKHSMYPFAQKVGRKTFQN